MVCLALKRALTGMPSSLPHFKVSPSVLGPLGAEQLQDPALAVLELIKNSWDADARKVTVAVGGSGKSRRILVVDNGSGMSEARFRSRWLVIGSPHKRKRTTSPAGRPLIGEKGLGRLATFALGRRIRIASAPSSGNGFTADVNWQELMAAPSLEDYEVAIRPKRRLKGTSVAIHELSADWTKEHTDFLVQHAEFLTSVPGQDFQLSLIVNGKRQELDDPQALISRFTEAELEATVGENGSPAIAKCVVAGIDESRVVFRDMKDTERDRRFAGVRICLKFFRRDEAVKQLSDALARNDSTALLERYQGVRVFRDGINVPPYGLNGDDWAGLEKQRTATGGPTAVPGNSQLVGEVHISRGKHPHLVITAGRSGFSSQTLVTSLAQYVRWAVRELGTARRAAKLGLTSGQVPARVDDRRTASEDEPGARARQALDRAARSPSVKRDPDARKAVAAATSAVASALVQSEGALRLYAQLASAGIAATSFSHELRADFDVISEAVDELTNGRRVPDKELLKFLNESWNRLRSFAALFKVIPVKIRRRRAGLSGEQLRASARAVLGLATPGTNTDVRAPKISVQAVPAELDSILLNFVSNAVKAINDSDRRDRGDILVTFAARGADLDIRVADNGCGISKKVAAVMFEPLEGKFSEGTGMGLPIVKFIAERYKGRVFVSPTPPPGFVTELTATLRGVVE